MNGWISVKFALPAYRGKFMVFNDSCFYVAWYKRFKNGKIQWASPFGGPILKHVTHWMVLPEPPNA